MFDKLIKIIRSMQKFFMLNELFNIYTYSYCLIAVHLLLYTIYIIILYNTERRDTKR